MAAKFTQKKESTFNQQTATRLTKFHCIDLGILEIDNQLRPRDYFDGAVPRASVEKECGEQEVEEEHLETELDQNLTEMGRTLPIQSGGT